VLVLGMLVVLDVVFLVLGEFVGHDRCVVRKRLSDGRRRFRYIDLVQSAGYVIDRWRSAYDIK